MDTKQNKSKKEQPIRENPSPGKSINDRDLNQDRQKQITNTEKEQGPVEIDERDTPEKKAKIQRKPSAPKRVASTESNRDKEKITNSDDNDNLIEEADTDNDKKGQA